MTTLKCNSFLCVPGSSLLACISTWIHISKFLEFLKVPAEENFEMILAFLFLQLVLCNVQGKKLLIETKDGYNSEEGVQVFEIFILFCYNVSLCMDHDHETSGSNKQHLKVIGFNPDMHGWCVSLRIVC